MITLPPLSDSSGIRHAFFTRAGGVSEGVYDSLNCGLGSGDALDRVRENHRRAMAALDLPTDALATLYQVHSPTAVEATRTWARGEAPRADGVATRTPGLALGILTADCAPVLFADADARVVGAAHAGWRGALAGVLEATVAAMETLGADRRRIVVGVGPCIAQLSYEVGPEFPAPFLASDPTNADFFLPARRAGHHLFDLSAYVARRLSRMGLARIAVAAHDTCADADRFFSYRRATLAHEEAYGRLLSTIVIED
jgi:hypothetical protein